MFYWATKSSVSVLSRIRMVFQVLLFSLLFSCCSSTLVYFRFVQKVNKTLDVYVLHTQTFLSIFPLYTSLNTLSNIHKRIRTDTCVNNKQLDRYVYTHTFFFSNAHDLSLSGLLPTAYLDRLLWSSCMFRIIVFSIWYLLSYSWFRN